jgi:N-acetylmuramoyl-L-alanine amidase
LTLQLCPQAWDNTLVRYKTLRRIQRLLLITGSAALLAIVLLVARAAGYNVPVLNTLWPPTLVRALFHKQIALISGHAGNDSGAVCTDAAGNTTITEAQVNAKVAELTAQNLRRAGADVLVLEEFDARLNGLQADLLLSIHADSCIDASGYKAARYQRSVIGARADQLVNCLDQHYAAITGLKHHPNTITHNMTEYHAFRVINPTTPAAILELGFLGGDQALLANHPEVAAQGIFESITCFMQLPQSP